MSNLIALMVFTFTQTHENPFQNGFDLNCFCEKEKDGLEECESGCVKESKNHGSNAKEIFN